jgi:hypothetical protein
MIIHLMDQAAKVLLSLRVRGKSFLSGQLAIMLNKLLVSHPQDQRAN